MKQHKTNPDFNSTISGIIKVIAYDFCIMVILHMLQIIVPPYLPVTIIVFFEGLLMCIAWMVFCHLPFAAYKYPLFETNIYSILSKAAQITGVSFIPDPAGDFKGNIIDTPGTIGQITEGIRSESKIFNRDKEGEDPFTR